MGFLTNVKIIIFFFLIWNLNYEHAIKNFIYLLILKQQTRECKKKSILCYFWNKLAEYFRDNGSKVGRFIKYLLWHQIIWKLITSPFLDLLPPIIISYPTINIKSFATTSPPMSLCSILLKKALFPKRKIGHLILAYYKLLIAKNVIVSVSLRRH